jgi:hypothetical protein
VKGCFIGLLAVLGPVAAHHSFAKEFDEKKPVSLRGMIIRVEWINPHIYLYLTVRDEDGNAANWRVESGSPLALERSGWTRDYLKAGDLVTIGGFQAKDGSNYASALQVRRKGAAQVYVPPDQK